MSVAAISPTMMAGAAAFALAISGGGAAQMQVPPAGPPPTEAEIAASPAAKRLKEAIDAIGRGEAAVGAFAAAHIAPGQVPASGQAGIVGRSRRSSRCSTAAIAAAATPCLASPRSIGPKPRRECATT